MLNYQIELERIIEQNKDKLPKLLLHSCCAPCSSYVLEYLSNFFSITIYYYNPNISPIDEYEKRVKEQIRLINEMPLKNKVSYVIGEYENDLFEKEIKGLEDMAEGRERCFKCYKLRLENTVKYAVLNNFDYFGTTLTVSPYKNTNKINEIGEYLSDKYNIKFLYSDFKKKNGYKRSIELSKIYSLYRQNYCGCIYSRDFKKIHN